MFRPHFLRFRQNNMSLGRSHLYSSLCKKSVLKCKLTFPDFSECLYRKPFLCVAYNCMNIAPLATHKVCWPGGSADMAGGADWFTTTYRSLLGHEHSGTQRAGTSCVIPTYRLGNLHVILIFTVCHPYMLYESVGKCLRGQSVHAYAAPI